jgi:very-short-patch-repair endonuclease
MIRRYTHDQLTQARRLRRAMTVAETMLWRGLRNRGIGAKFRRQVPVGPYVADFLCIDARLIVELDGPPHEEAEQHFLDTRRDVWLVTQGWQVLRFSNDIVIGGGNIVLEEIQRAVEAAGSPSSGPRCRGGHLLPLSGEGVSPPTRGSRPKAEVICLLVRRHKLQGWTAARRGGSP